MATSQGAVTELVKNAYDADAKICVILFTPSKGEILEELTERRFESLSSVFPEAGEYYPRGEAGRRLRPGITPVENEALAAAFQRIPQLWIVDNGHGMSAKTIAEQWMVIGTDTKEVDGVSEGGRVMTGAKGIGRFALDRLGQQCEMFSAKAAATEIAHWIVDWGDFEGRGKIITDVEAVLDTETTSLGAVYDHHGLTALLPSHMPTLESIPGPLVAYDKGTAIRLSWLHDGWDDRDNRKLRDTLEALLPPRDQSDFSIFMYDFRSPERGGFLDNFPPDQFDYRLKAVVATDGSVSIKLDRQEIDVDRISPTVFTLPAMQQPGFSKRDFERGNRTYDTNLRTLLRLKNVAEEEQYRAIGPLDFTLYFFKLSNPTRDNLERFPQKHFDATKRKRWLASSGGVRLYRDEFRVRPYGEPNTQGSDWLLLGQRVASNPAPASRIGWRVPPQQLAGTIHITKEANPVLADQSNREGIMNERAFAAFRRIILALIGEFERDRAYIYHQFDKAYELDHAEEVAVEEGRQLAEKLLLEAATPDAPDLFAPPAGAADQDGLKMAKALEAEQQKSEALREDLQVLRGMATLGTVLVSFTHELKQIKANMSARRQRMENALKRVIDEERLAAVPDPVNPFNIVARWSREDEKVSRWVDFALSAVSPAKRRRRVIEMREYLDGLAEYWREFLASKASVMRVECRSTAAILAHEIDLDSIFFNLIVNSVEAFVRPTSDTSREIRVTVDAKDDIITIDYRDTGPGLSPTLNIADDIFAFGVSSKSEDDAGGPEGTGIGMWLVQNIVHDYGGTTILQCRVGEPGFALAMTLPVHSAGQGGA